MRLGYFCCGLILAYLLLLPRVSSQALGHRLSACDKRPEYELHTSPSRNIIGSCKWHVSQQNPLNIHAIFCVYMRNEVRITQQATLISI